MRLLVYHSFQQSQSTIEGKQTVTKSIPMNQQASNQLFRPYVPAALRDALDAGLLRAGQIGTYQASILYADLSGFTRLTAAFATLADGAERLHSILRDYFETMIATITANGGDVIHIAGDALSAWWPSIADPTLAIHCGYALHNAIAALNPIPTPFGPYSFELRVGVSAGQVHLLLAGIPNQGIHPVLMGTPIYAASFAEQHAQPGQVQLLLTNSVYKPTPPYQSPLDAPVLTWEHFLPPSFARRLRLNTLVAEYRRCVPVFAAFDLPANPMDLQPLVTQAQAIAMRWGGWLNEIEIGNKGAVLVFLFGAPVAHGDDTSRAIGCALELRDRGVIRKAGISVGSLFVGEVGGRLRRVYTAQGEDMNLAAHLMKQATDGEILISGRVRQDVLGRYRTSVPQLMMIKGYEQLIPVASVLIERIHTDDHDSHALRAALPDHVTLIGREQERQLIDQLVEDAGQQGKLLLIEGETGIGKSSLLHYIGIEWLKRGYMGLRGECRIGTRERTLYPWRTILGELCGIDDSEPTPVRRARFQQVLAKLPFAASHQVAALAHLLDIEGCLAPLQPLDLAPLVIELLLQRLKYEPVLLILEDVHWADRETLLLLQEVVEALLPQYPLLVVVSYRPLPNHLAPLMQQLQHYPFSIHRILERLASADRTQLVCELIGVTTVDARLLQYLERYAGGQPLFIKEYVRSLLEKRLIRIEGDTAHLLGSPPHVQLSSSAVGIVQARIDQMEERTSLTLKVAAVIGRSFPLRLLHHIHPAHLSEAELRQDIDILLNYQLIETEMTDPEPVYRFTFGFAHEVAYTSLLFGQRRDLHQAVYQWYLTNYQAELERWEAPLAVYDVIIAHALRAEQASIAMEYCRRAALIATSQSLFSSAFHYIEHGLRLTGHVDQRVELLVLRIILNYRIGNHLHQAEDIAQIQDLFGAYHQPTFQAIVAVMQLHHTFISGQFELFDTHTASAQAQVAQLGQQSPVVSRFLQACIELIKAQYFTFNGQQHQVLTHLHGINRLFTNILRQTTAKNELNRLLSPRALLAQSYELQGWILIELGNLRRAQRRWARAVAIARVTNDWLTENRAIIGLCRIQFADNPNSESEHQLQQALHIARSLGDRYGQVLGLHTQALLCLHRGDRQMARRLLWQAIAIANSTQIGVLEMMLLNQLAELGEETAR